MKLVYTHPINVLAKILFSQGAIQKKLTDDNKMLIDEELGFHQIVDICLDSLGVPKDNTCDELPYKDTFCRDSIDEKLIAIFNSKKQSVKKYEKELEKIAKYAIELSYKTLDFNGTIVYILQDDYMEQIIEQRQCDIDFLKRTKVDNKLYEKMIADDMGTTLEEAEEVNYKNAGLDTSINLGWVSLA